MSDDAEQVDFEALDKEINWGTEIVSDPVIVSSLSLGVAVMEWSGHECSDPTHKDDKHENVLCLMFYDMEGKEHPIFLHPDTKLLDDLCDMDIYYQIKSLRENYLKNLPS